MQVEHDPTVETRNSSSAPKVHKQLKNFHLCFGVSLAACVEQAQENSFLQYTCCRKRIRRLSKLGTVDGRNSANQLRYYVKPAKNNKHGRFSMSTGRISSMNIRRVFILTDCRPDPEIRSATVSLRCLGRFVNLVAFRFPSGDLQALGTSSLESERERSRGMAASEALLEDPDTNELPQVYHLQRHCCAVL